MPSTFRSHHAPSHSHRASHRAPAPRLLAVLTGLLVLLVAPAAHAATTTLEGWGHSEWLGLSGVAGSQYVVPTPLPSASEATAAAVGHGSSFVLTPSGVLAAGSGTIGLGTAGTIDAPFTLLPGTAGARAVSAGEDARLILLDNGTVLGFGSNEYGSAGGTVNQAVLTPTSIAGLGDVTAIAAGGTFSLALEADGSVWAWGSAESLGSEPAASGPNTGMPTQVALPAGQKAVAIAAGFGHGLALLEDGSVWAWGSAFAGQVGNGIGGGAASVAAPVQAIAPPAVGAPRVTEISAGAYSSFALYSDGSFQAWGYNGEGELGLGNEAQEVPTPTAPSAALRTALPDNYPPLKQISAVGFTTYAIATSDDGVTGPVLAWGSNGEGQLGFGAGASSYDFAFPYTGAAGTTGQTDTEIPQRVGRLQDVPWLGVGSTGAAQIAPTEPTLQVAGLSDQLPFFSQALGTTSAPARAQLNSPGDPTTVTNIHITGADAGDFEIVGYNTNGAVGNTEQLPITVSSGGALYAYVRFIPSALGERFATLQVEGDGETASIQLSGYGTELPGNTLGAQGPPGATVVGATGPAGPLGPAGPTGAAGKNGVVVFEATASKASVKPGHTASLHFVFGNGTTSGFPKTKLSLSAPKGLHVSAGKSATLASLAAGKSRAVTLKLRVGAKTKRGSYRVTVTWELGSRKLTRTVQVRVL
jgi:hypothetical protein